MNIKLLKNLSRNNDINYYWILSFTFLFALFFFRFPFLSYDSQIIMEVGYLYLPEALQQKSFIKTLFSSEAGYLVPFQRAISYISIKLFPLFYFPYILDITALILASFYLSFICSNENRFLIKSDLLRFIFSMHLVFFQSFYFLELGMVGYYTIIIILLLLFQNKEKFSKTKYILYIIFLIIFSIGKVHTCLSVPFILVAIIYHIKHKQIKSALFWALPIIFMIYHILYLISSALKNGIRYTNNISQNLESTHIYELINIYLIYPLKSYFGLITTLNEYSFMNILLGIFLILFVLFNIYKHYSKGLFNRINFFILTSLALSLMLILLSHIGQGSPQHHLLTYVRGIHVAFIVFCIAMLVFIYNFIRIKLLQIFSILLLLVIILINSNAENDDERDYDRHNLAWKKNYMLLLNDDYYLPIYTVQNWFPGVWKNNIMLYNKFLDNEKGITSNNIINGVTKIRALIVQDNHNELSYAIAYNKKSQSIGKAKLYSDNPRNSYRFLNFDGDKVSPSSIKFFDNNNKEINATIIIIAGSLE